MNDCKKDQTEMKRHLVSKATIQLIEKKDLLSLILGACLNLSRTVFLFPDETIFSFQGLQPYPCFAPNLVLIYSSFDPKSRKITVNTKKKKKNEAHNKCIC